MFYKISFWLRICCDYGDFENLYSTR